MKLEDIGCEDIPAYIREAMMASDDKAKTILELGEANQRAKENLVRRKSTQAANMDIIETHPNGRQVGLEAIITADGHGWAKVQGRNVEYQQQGLQGYVEKFMPKLTEHLTTTHLGLSRNKKLGDDFAAAVFDKTSDNPLVETMRKEWETANDFLRKSFNDLGGDIGKLADEGYLPQSHASEKLIKEGREEWIPFISKLLDFKKMGIPVNKAEKYLNDMFDTISTGGLNKVDDTAVSVKGKSLVNKHSDQRFLKFKNGPSWQAYQKRFGNEDPMATIDDYVKEMTTEISLMKIFGPNPDSAFKTLADYVVRKNTLDGVKSPGAGIDKLRREYANVSGATARDAGEVAYGPYLQIARGMNSANLLGQAIVSALPDIGGIGIIAGTNKMNPLNAWGGFVKNFSMSWDKATFLDKQLLGLGADVFNSSVTRRFNDLGKGFWSSATEALLRGTLLNVWTESARMSFKSMYLNKHLAMMGKTLDQLSPAEHIDLLAKVNEEASYAVIMGSAKSQSITNLGHAKGTAIGEWALTTTQFLTYPIEFMYKMGAKMFIQGSLGSRIAVVASVASIYPFLGALSLMGKDATKGYGPREGFNLLDPDVDAETKAKFWGAASMQGLGLGIFGDFLFSTDDRYGGKFEVTLGGPTLGLATEPLLIAKKNAIAAAEGEDTHVGSDLYDYTVRRILPIENAYTKTILENYVSRNIKMALDDDYEKKERQKLRKRRKEYGQEQFEWLQDSKEDVTESLGL